MVGVYILYQNVESLISMKNIGVFTKIYNLMNGCILRYFNPKFIDVNKNLVYLVRNKTLSL